MELNQISYEPAVLVDCFKLGKVAFNVQQFAANCNKFVAADLDMELPSGKVVFKLRYEDYFFPVSTDPIDFLDGLKRILEEIVFTDELGMIRLLEEMIKKYKEKE